MRVTKRKGRGPWFFGTIQTRATECDLLYEWWVRFPFSTSYMVLYTTRKY